MIKHIFAGLALLPLVAFGQVDNPSVGRDKSGNVRIIDGNYECSYGSIGESGASKEKFKSATIYTENMENDTILFIVSFPGDISVNPPIAKKASQTTDSVSYQYTDNKDKVFIIGANTNEGLYAALGMKNEILHASTLVYDCKMIKNLEHPMPTD
ncbi:hypothetical protein [Providencia rustigianii]|uniref:hypothetical protein n=1 Tax=Providencia rustigianii TaxID=158850 RepID=UPI0038B34A12